MDKNEIEDVFDKIIEAAKDGQDGSAMYALGRLALVRSLAEGGKKKLRRKVI